MRVLLLGGTSEASALAALLAARPDIEATLSLAGRTGTPAAAPIPMRSGGFGGAAGLAAYIAADCIDVLVDATHPFAARISENARIAAALCNVPLVALSRPPWTPEPADRWIDVADMAAAALALGAKRRRVFLAIGRQQVDAFAAAPQHFYLIRAIGAVAPKLPDYRLIAARGPFDADAEERLMRAEKIDVLVAKNSGAAAVYGKIIAARRLGVPVIMVARPPQGEAAAHDPAEALARILAHGAGPARRAV